MGGSTIREACLAVRFDETLLSGAYIINPEKDESPAGFSTRVFDAPQFAARELENRFVRMDSMYFSMAGVVAGLNYQLPPRAEARLIRCIRGSVHTVIVDLREDSSTFEVSFATEQKAKECSLLYVPKGFALGFMGLERGSEVLCLSSEPDDPDLHRGIRWDDRRFKIQWPLRPRLVPDKYRFYPDFDPTYHLKA